MKSPPSLLAELPYSVSLTTIIRLHPKEEPDQDDNHVKPYRCVSIWILCWPVLLQSGMFSYFPLCLNKTDQHVVSEHMLISQFCFRIHYSGIKNLENGNFKAFKYHGCFESLLPKYLFSEKNCLIN